MRQTLLVLFCLVMSVVVVPRRANACSPPQGVSIVANHSASDGRLLFTVHCEYNAFFCDDVRTGTRPLAPTVTDANGNVIAGVFANRLDQERSLLAHFVPNTPLVPEATYSIELDVAENGVPVSAYFVVRTKTEPSVFDGLAWNLGTSVAASGDRACCDVVEGSCVETCVYTGARRVAHLRPTMPLLPVSYVYRRKNAVPASWSARLPSLTTYDVAESGAQSVCFTLEAYRLVDGQIMEAPYCTAPDATQVYGAIEPNYDDAFFPGSQCLRPPFVGYCPADASASECPAASPEILRAWCEQNSACASDSSAAGCIHYNNYCNSNGGCSVAGARTQPFPLGWIVIGLLALVGLRKNSAAT